MWLTILFCKMDFETKKKELFCLFLFTQAQDQIELFINYVSN